MNPNTNKPWNADEDYWWEKPDREFWGLRNPRADYNRVLFAECASGIAVFWVNVKNTSAVPFKYVSRRKIMKLDEARHLWNSLIHPSQGFVPDDSTPPRMVNPCHDPSFKSVVSKSYDKYIENRNDYFMKEKCGIKNYALEA